METDYDLCLPHVHSKAFPSLLSMSSTLPVDHSSSSMDSALIIKSSAYNCSQVQPEQNSRDKALSTTMQSRGLRTEPWAENYNPPLTLRGVKFQYPKMMHLKLAEIKHWFDYVNDV